MAEATRAQTEQDRVAATITRLVTAADGDTLYRDVYLRRAAEMLSPTVTQARYEILLVEREDLTRLLGQARAALGRNDWVQVRECSTRASDLQRALQTEQKSLASAEAVYGAPPVALDPLSPGLTQLVKRWPDAARARADTTAALAELAGLDSAAQELYRSRQQALEALAVAGKALPGAEAQEKAAGTTEQQAFEALERGDADALRGLAESMVGAPATDRPASEATTPTRRQQIVVPATLAAPLPEACLQRAAALGLEPVETTFASPAVATAVADFVEQYALGASPAVHDQARDGVVRVWAAAQEAKILPPEVTEVFAETVSLFALHLYVNSAGLRYFPVPVPREALLVESHADDAEPVTPLLSELGFDRRRGLSRDEIERQLLKNGARIVAEHLGLDPLAFRVVCVPPDVFMRLGGARGWGKREEWTHFDGYQVVKGGRLRALVGGNAHFGGLADLCGISRDDGRENVVVRFAVVRRDRLGVRLA